MQKGYAIKCEKSISQNCFVIETLARDSRWYVTTNNGSFRTLREAQAFFKTSNHDLRGSFIWIEGPKGGRHSLFAK